MTNTMPASFVRLNKGLNQNGNPINLTNEESPSLQNINFNAYGALVKRNGYKYLNTTKIPSTGGGGGSTFDKGGDLITSGGAFVQTYYDASYDNVFFDFIAISNDVVTSYPIVNWSYSYYSFKSINYQLESSLVSYFDNVYFPVTEYTGSGYNISVYTSTNRGVNWTREVVVTGTNYTAAIDVDSDGDVSLVWNKLGGNLGVIKKTGAVWGNIQVLSTTGVAVIPNCMSFDYNDTMHVFGQGSLMPTDTTWSSYLIHAWMPLLGTFTGEVVASSTTLYMCSQELSHVIDTANNLYVTSGVRQRSGTSKYNVALFYKIGAANWVNAGFCDNDWNDDQRLERIYLDGADPVVIYDDRQSDNISSAKYNMTTLSWEAITPIVSYNNFGFHSVKKESSGDLIMFGLLPSSVGYTWNYIRNISNSWTSITLADYTDEYDSDPIPLDAHKLLTL